MSNRIEDLDPVFQPIATRILLESQVRIAQVRPGSRISAASTWRTPAQQESVQATGASNLSIGYHNYGRALDVAIYDERGHYIDNGADPLYAIFGQVAKEEGCRWGGDWADQDYDHCEYTNGLTFSEFYAWLRAHPLPVAA